MLNRFRPSAIAVALLSTTTAALLAATTADGASRADTARISAPIATTASAFAVSRPARELAPAGPHAVVTPPRINPLAGEPDHGARGTWTRGASPLDPLVAPGRSPATPTPPLKLEFDGLTNECDGCSPPDTNGDIGGKDYVQIVNATKIGIYAKKTGAELAEFDLGTLWGSGDCASDVGDPVVLYDGIAKRWVLSQLASTNSVCFAVSQTSDPAGSYYLYTFPVTDFPDYFKIGVWPDAYLGAANQSTYSAMAFDRKKMLVGDPNAGLVRFTGETNFLMPSDVNDASQPAGGGYFFTFKDDQYHGGKDRIELFQLTPNFKHTEKSSFTLIDTFDIASFTYTVCGFFNFDCIPQKGTSVTVDAVSEWPMQRLAYRKVGGNEELVGNFTVGGGTATPGAAIRWFELRNSGSGWTLYQEGTQDLGDGLNRWMGSIAMDAAGDIALGYSASSGNDYPSIRYATRKAGDPLGTLGAEQILKAGGGSQTGSDRWGDYSGMAIDPAGCKFWYTTEYYGTNSSSNWQTAVGAFKIPNCTP